MSISWEQIEGGLALRNKIAAYAAPKFNHVEKMIPRNSQTIFTLTYKPTVDTVKMSINGLTYYEGTHFTVNRDSATPRVIWYHTKPNGGFSIEEGYKVFIDYWSLTRKEG